MPATIVPSDELRKTHLLSDSVRLLKADLKAKPSAKALLALQAEQRALNDQAKRCREMITLAWTNPRRP